MCVLNEKRCKRNPDYTYMLEHVTTEYANQYLNILQNKFSSFYTNNLNYLKDICAINDQLAIDSRPTNGN